MPYVTAKVEEGLLRGIRCAGVSSFLGVPYGASTGGKNRFLAPQPALAWSGTRDALAYGPACPQVDLRLEATASFARMLPLLIPRTGSAIEGGAIDEDCLRLNIWTPSTGHAESLPVLVWLHGGGYYLGSGNGMAASGDVLAAAANVVVVSITHRLGLLGFLDLRELGEPDSALAGMLDIVAALEWIQRNIHAFGGDPRSVTIWGQSGGGGKVATLNAMPSARDLFARSIIMSGPFGRAYSTDAACALRTRAMELADVASVDELREASLERLLEAQATAPRDVAAGTPATGIEALDLTSVPSFGPSHDLNHLPVDAFGHEATEGIRDKQLLIGWTSHESTSFLVADPTYTAAMTRQEAAARVDALAAVDGVTYDELATQFPDEAPHLLLGRRLSRLQFEGPSRRIADLAAEKASGVWAYEFQQPTEVLGGLLGATHSLDVPYAFGTVDRIPMTGRSEDRHDVARSMMRAWASFAHHADPGWEPWTRDKQVHTFGTPHGPNLRLPEDADLTRPLM